jgi:hypothetical protein
LAKTCVAAFISSFCCVGREPANHDVISETDHLVIEWKSARMGKRRLENSWLGRRG